MTFYEGVKNISSLYWVSFILSVIFHKLYQSLLHCNDCCTDVFYLILYFLQFGQKSATGSRWPDGYFHTVWRSSLRQGWSRWSNTAVHLYHWKTRGFICYSKGTCWWHFVYMFSVKKMDGINLCDLKTIIPFFSKSTKENQVKILFKNIMHNNALQKFNKVVFLNVTGQNYYFHQ